ncbi:hypothetical protein KIPB_000048 [Kipferlia bialata]|uniref:Uncharacterized protein n=1 Tax=Kipferlia bialata TaxID=797122 RepID=A0A9K3CN70_9EUKA|nr:hypothetical protein KIPB_000048 [Kipferlia bialata]|eukprot:g48.t1
MISPTVLRNKPVPQRRSLCISYVPRDRSQRSSGSSGAVNADMRYHTVVYPGSTGDGGASVSPPRAYLDGKSHAIPRLPLRSQPLRVPVHVHIGKKGEGEEKAGRTRGRSGVTQDRPFSARMCLLDAQPSEEMPQTERETEREIERLGLDQYPWGQRVANCNKYKYKELYMFDKGIGPQGAKALALVLPSMTALTVLGLSNNMLGDVGARALADVLPSLPGLTHLALAGIDITPLGAGALGRALESLTNLKLLDLSDNDLGGLATDDLSRALTHMPRLEWLLLSNAHINAAGMDAIAWALPSLTWLQRLYLGHNSIGEVGARLLGQGLPVRLTHLSVEDNSIGDTGVTLLAQSIVGYSRPLTCLHMLDVSSNGIGDSGAKAVATSIKTLPLLREVSLNSNCLTFGGAWAVARAKPRECRCEMKGNGLGFLSKILLRVLWRDTHT